MPIKFLILEGGGVVVFWKGGGVEVPILFLRAWGFFRWKFQGFGGIWANFGKIREISGKVRGTQWNSVGFSMALKMNSVPTPTN